MARRILIQELSNFQYLGYKRDFYLLPKDKMVFNILKNWVENSLKAKKIAHGDFMPKKNELATLFNVSTATVQNAIRYAEDLGYFTSRQRVGTMVNDKRVAALNEKMFSKKDILITKLKRTISKCNIGAILPSARKISLKIGTSHNTIRMALKILEKEGYIKQKLIKGNESCWEVLKNAEIAQYDNITKKTLAQIYAEKIKIYVSANYKINEKIMKTTDFATMFNVSAKTINDATKILNKEGFLLSRRGKYGTLYINSPQKTSKKLDKTMFMTGAKPKAKVPQYKWEQALAALQKYIMKNFDEGDKIPSIKDLAKILNFNASVVKKAVSKLSELNILISTCGKYGGTFINEMPNSQTNEKYTWLAISKE